MGQSPSSSIDLSKFTAAVCVSLCKSVCGGGGAVRLPQLSFLIHCFELDIPAGRQEIFWTTSCVYCSVVGHFASSQDWLTSLSADSRIHTLWVSSSHLFGLIFYWRWITAKTKSDAVGSVSSSNFAACFSFFSPSVGFYQPGRYTLNDRRSRTMAPIIPLYQDRRCRSAPWCAKDQTALIG